MQQYITGALAVILAIIVIIFSVQNLSSVDVSFLVWSMTVPKVLLILGTYVLGMLSGWGLVAIIKNWLT
ncbi:MAG: DUF1049 domain-containing protein [Planctomycetaceae bacterium]|nr:MAG: DUF1049 domain-containing protein [Planctomycetaceae bacterium]